jgi:hypothetical protein
MDSRVPGVPKDGALEAREAKFIETGPAGAERTREWSNNSDDCEGGRCAGYVL